MKKLLLVFLLLVVVVSGASAQSEAALTYNGITFSYVPEAFGAVLPRTEPGTPYQADAPYFANIAPHTIFTFTRPNTALPEITWTGQLLVYRIADLEGYEELSYQEVIDQFRALDTSTLGDYANASPSVQTSGLPFMPMVNAAQVLRLHPSALNIGSVEGIQYYTYFSQAADPILEGYILYTYQGITTDGQYYISFSIPVETGVLETTIPQDVNWDEFAANYSTYLEETFTALNEADPAAFKPALDTLQNFIASITIGE